MEERIIETLLDVWPQWAACLTVSLLSITFGLAIGWTSPYLAQLTSDKGLFRITEIEASWVASLLPFGRMFGAFAGATILEYYGSKMAVLSSGVPVSIGLACIIFANSASWLYVSRICSGTSLGMFFSCFSLYVGEIASPTIRGALVTTIMNGVPIGILIGNIMGTQVSMMWFGIISSIPSMSYLAIFPFLPHTPHYLIRRDKLDEAKRTILWYRRKTNVEAELELIGTYVKASGTMNFRDKLKQISEKRYRRIFATVLLLFTFMQLGGVNTVVFYMEIIVKKGKVTSIEPGNVAIIASALGIIVGWISVILIDRYSRRILMAVSCCCVIVAMLLLTIHFSLLEKNQDQNDLEWMPILAMMLFMMITLGLIPIPSTMLGEVFPANLKSIAGFLVSIVSALFAFICSRTYQPMVEHLTEKYVYGFYAILMTICLIYSIYRVPEIKGKTLQEIQEILARETQGEERT